MTSEELDSASKYQIIELTWPRSSVLAEHRASIPKVLYSITALVRDIRDV